jgi:hypothetical protein
MNEVVLETFKDRLAALCREMDIDAAFFIFAYGDGELYGGSVSNGKKSPAASFVKALETANLGALKTFKGQGGGR